MYLFYCLEVILIWLGLLSLRNGIQFARYVSERLANPESAFTPFASVIVPLRGLDRGTRENAQALFSQHYPAHEIIFVTDSPDDPSLAVIEDVRRVARAADGPQSRILIAGESIESGQKVHNLRVAAGAVSAQSEVFVFVDTDVQVSANWLRSLIVPLSDQRIGATTGYRWFVPVSGKLASHLRSVWNASIASALGRDTRKNFCWGGSTAIRREIFDQLSVRERWKGTVSDDFALTRVLHDAGLPIEFIPQCLTPSFEECGFGELIEFTNRQLKITRAYASHLWQAVLAGSLLFVLGFFGGIVVLAARGLTAGWLPPVLLSIIFFLGALKSQLRLRAVRLVIPDPRLQSPIASLAHIVLWPVASALFLYNAIVATFSRRINWRGITYELKSPTETVIISRDHK